MLCIDPFVLNVVQEGKNRELARLRGHEGFDVGGGMERNGDSSDDATETLPLLTAQKLHRGQLKHHALVRFHGIVQNVLDPQLFLNPQHGEVGPGKNDGERFAQRTPLICTAIPGSTSWILEEIQVCVPMQEVCEASNGEKTSSLKRPADHETVDEANEIENDLASQAANKGVLKKQQQEEDVQENKPSTVAAMKKRSWECIVQMYEEKESDQSYRVNAIYEFVGVLDIDPRFCEAEERGDVWEPYFLESLESSELHSFTPRLHCFVAYALNTIQFVLPRPLCAPLLPNTRESSLSSTAKMAWLMDTLQNIQPDCTIASVREKLSQTLSHCCGGDVLSADYLLLALISHVQRRVQLHPIGNLSINFIPCDDHQVNLLNIKDESFASWLQRQLEDILPFVHRFDLSIETLCSHRLYPAKDYESGAMLTSDIQLPDQSVLVIDETKLSEGKLNEVGFRNLAALQSIVEHQQMPYDFHYYSMDFPVDKRVIVVSPTKSILNCTTPIVMKPKRPAQSLDHLSETELHCIRLYIAAMKEMTYSFEENPLYTEKEFVDRRRKDPSISGDDLHQWLSVAGLVALSFGATQMTEEHWKYAMDLEDQRTQRHALHGSNTKSSHRP